MCSVINLSHDEEFTPASFRLGQDDWSVQFCDDWHYLKKIRTVLKLNYTKLFIIYALVKYITLFQTALLTCIIDGS